MSLISGHLHKLLDSAHHLLVPLGDSVLAAHIFNSIDGKLVELGRVDGLAHLTLAPTLLGIKVIGGTVRELSREKDLVEHDRRRHEGLSQNVHRQQLAVVNHCGRALEGVDDVRIGLREEHHISGPRHHEVDLVGVQGGFTGQHEGGAGRTPEAVHVCPGGEEQPQLVSHDLRT